MGIKNRDDSLKLKADQIELTLYLFNQSYSGQNFLPSMKLSLRVFLVFVLMFHVVTGLTLFAAYLPDFEQFKV